MTDLRKRWPPSSVARLAGALWIAVIVTGLFAEVMVRSNLVVGTDPVATARNILASEQLFRWGIGADLLGVICYAAVTLLLYELLRSVDRNTARLATGFGLIGTAVLAGDIVNLHAPLMLLKSSALAGLGTSTTQSLALAALKLHGFGYIIALTFFAVQVSCLGYLVWQSGFLPRILGVLLMVEGALGLINSFSVILSPPLAAYFYSFILLPGLFAEGGTALWLLLKGVGPAGDPQRSETTQRS